jgi:hypothetical protein
MTMTTARVKRTRREVRSGLGKCKGTKDGEGKWKGKGKGNGRGKGIVRQSTGEMISLVQLLWSCNRKGMRQTLTRRAN